MRQGNPAVAFVDFPNTRMPYRLFNYPAGATLTNQLQVEAFWNSTDANAIWRADLDEFTQIRLMCRVLTTSASVNTPRLRLRFRNAFSTTLTDYADIGTSEVSASLSASGFATSGWTNLAAGAKIADCYIALTQIGGDGAADPAVAVVTADVR